jgi:hypothetical protein
MSMFLIQFFLDRHPGPSTACKAGAQDELQPKAEG